MDPLHEHPIFTDRYFETLLRTDRSDSTICVRSVRSRPAVALGENYSSQLLRVSVSYTADNNENTTAESNQPPLNVANFIVKSEIKGSAVNDLLDDFGVFRKEIECYTKLLPAAELLLKSIGDDTKLAPKCYDASVEHSYLVLEDLSASGFATQPRHDGLSVAHFRLLFTKLAKWHATSATLLRSDPSLADRFAFDQFEPTNVVGQQIRTNLSSALAAAAKLMPSTVCQRVGDKIEALLPTVGERVWQAMRRRNDTFNVIAHGDMWSNNIMFQHVGGDVEKPTDALLVDFQVGVHRSPVADVLYALFSSSHETITGADWRSLFERYHQQLADTLTQLAYPAADIPSLAALWQDWQRLGAGAAIQFPVVAAVRMCTIEGGMNIACLVGTTAEDAVYRRDLFLNCVTHPKGIEFLLEFSDECGFFD